MYEYDTTNVESDLADKSKDDEIPVIANGLERQVPTSEVNENYVKSSGMLPK